MRDSKNQVKVFKRCAEVIGEIGINNQGCKMIIKSGRNKKDIDVEFEGNVIIYNTRYCQFISGQISNPYLPSVCGVGYNGIGKHIVSIKGKDTKKHRVWCDMIKRCYSKNRQVKQPTYIPCTVDVRWHNFQVFGDWYDEFYVEGFELDKDIRMKGNKIYSPETCCFVSKEINGLFIKSNKTRGKYPIGVHYDKKSKKFVAQISINSERNKIDDFNTPEEAFYAYKIEKETYIKLIANKWRGQITEDCYWAMMDYIVEETD